MKETNAFSSLGLLNHRKPDFSVGFRLQLFQIVLNLQLCVFGFIFGCIFNNWLLVPCKTNSSFPGSIHHLSDRGMGEGRCMVGGGGGGGGTDSYIVI